MGRWVRVVSLGCILLGSAGAAQRIAFHESYTQAANVAGVRLVGLYRGELTGEIDLSHLAIDLPPDAMGNLCVVMTTRDALYLGEADFTMSPPSGAVPLLLTTKYQKELARYRQSEFAVRAQVRPNCESGVTTAYVAAVFPGGQRNRLTILLNARQNDVSAQLLDEQSKSTSAVRCQTLVEGVRTAFDTVCSADLGANPDRIRTLQITVTGLTGRQTSENYPLKLRA